MFKILALLALALVSPACFAAYNVQISCSGTTPIYYFMSPQNTNISCTGDLALSNGFITDGTAISLSALGNLTLSGITFTAPSISLAANSFISMAGVSITGPSVMSLTTGYTPGLSPVSWLNTVSHTTTIAVNGASTNLGNLLVSNPSPIPAPSGVTPSIPPVPEPGTYATMLIGLLFLAGLLRTSRYKSHFAA